MKKYILYAAVAAGVTVGCAKDAQTIELRGGLYMKGSSPHNYLVIEDQKSHQQYKIRNARVFKLAKKQKQTVTLKVKLVKKAAGPGFPAMVDVVEIK